MSKKRRDIPEEKEIPKLTQYIPHYADFYEYELPLILPKTVLISILVHWNVMIDSDNQIQNFILGQEPEEAAIIKQEEIELIMITVSPVGTTCFMNDNIDYQIQELIDTFVTESVNMNPNIDLDKPIYEIAHNMNENLKKDVVSLESEFTIKIRKMNKTHKNKTQIYKDMVEASHHYDQMYTISKFKTGDAVPNKIFSLKESDKSGSPKYDLKVCVLNMFETPNLLDYDFISEKYTYINYDPIKDENTLFFELNALIEYLKTKGVQKIICIDFTCSTADKLLTKREIRSARRSTKKRK